MKKNSGSIPPDLPSLESPPPIFLDRLTPLTAMTLTAMTATSESKGHVYEEPGYFQYPLTPYGIQVKFMQNLYSVLESGGVGIFESPTGTVS